VKPHWILFPFSIVYGLVVWLRNLFFEIGVLHSVDVGVPVISIGNNTAGGTGKTPLVVDVVRILMESGKKPAVISRGYGRVTHGTIVVCNGSDLLATAASAGDEPIQIARMTGHAIVIVDEDRVRGARKAIKDFGADVIVLDDGFQHRYLQRTKDIVLIDAQQPPFETMMIPAGYRRESMGSLKRADAIIVTKSESVSAAGVLLNDRRIDFEGEKFSSSYQPVGIKHLFGGIEQSLEILKGRTAVVFCGIAKPESFLKQLNACGVIIQYSEVFPDHHRFTDADISSVINRFQSSSADFILTTEKDAARLDEFEDRLTTLPVSALMMNVDVHQKEEWKQYLLDGLTL